MNPLRTLMNWFARLKAWGIVISASAIFVTGVTVALSVADRTTSLFLAIVFSLFAGFVYALTIPQALAKRAQQKEAEHQIREQALRNALREQRNLEAEIARYQSMKINVESYKPILRLNLLSVKSSIRDYVHTLAPEDNFKGGGLFGLGQKDYRTLAELFNVVRVEFEANLGVDLQALRFHEVSPGEVVVTGFQRDFQGFQNFTTHKELSARLERVVRADSGEETATRFVEGHAAALQKSDELQDAIIRRVNNGVEFQHLDEGIRRMTEAFLKVIFSPLGVQLRFAPGSGTQGVGLLEFLDTKNRLFDEHIEQLKARQQLVPLELARHADSQEEPS